MAQSNPAITLDVAVPGKTGQWAKQLNRPRNGHALSSRSRADHRDACARAEKLFRDLADISRQPMPVC